jgi:hypothetical protein
MSEWDKVLTERREAYIHIKELKRKVNGGGEQIKSDFPQETKSRLAVEDHNQMKVSLGLCVDDNMMIMMIINIMIRLNCKQQKMNGLSIEFPMDITLLKYVYYLRECMDI